jgi:sec-independent protein translocase protein TatA|tara:strand:+ start:1590 stop:1847 length:258 start_codon:yes stop_codon:yes gene_type:complete
VGSLAFLSTNELLIVALVGIVLFGGAQLPKLARNLGRAQKELQAGIAEASAEVETKKSESEDKAPDPTSESDRDSESEEDSNSSS